MFVQLAGPGAADVAARSNGSARSAQVRRDQVRRSAGAVLAAARRSDSSATTLFTVTNAVPGIGMRLDAAGLKAVADNADVVKISRLAAKTLSNANVAGLVKAVNTWNYNGNTGKGVKIGVIDTGLDYTHADFGGVGTSAAYDAAKANSTDPGWRDALPALAKAKIKGGYDFVGDDYDANDPASMPLPDTNPLDCNEHGTHVSGTATGYGVGRSGRTFTGDYTKLDRDRLLKMDIGPGMAPSAKLYALKVFGCQGSTNEVIPALDWALDPNGDGDFTDHLDIVNLSLGSDYGPADDPENAVVDEIAKHGVLSVIAMGNNGDLTDTGGTPGNAISSLAVASSVDALQQRDGIRVNAPSGVDGITAGQMSIAYDWPNNGPTKMPVTGDVVAIPGDNADGCEPFSAAETSAVAGKVVWLEWDDNDATRRCGSVGRSGNAQQAGAIGSIFTSGRDVFGSGITGSAVIPVFQLPKAGTDKLRPAVNAGTLNVTFDGALQGTIKDINNSISDTLSSFSSRGPHGSIGVVKPDVAAPGDTVSSAGMGTGNKVLTISGTSMATPVTAGVSALVQSAHRDWSPLLVKAAVMNTAGHDVWTGPSKTGHRYAPARVGSGRIDAKRAASTKVLAYASGRHNPVSASFGVVPAPVAGGTVTRTKKITVRNFDKTPVSVKLSYDAVNTQPGVSYSVFPTSLKLGKNGLKTATVTMKVNPSALRHTIDPTMAVKQTNRFYGEDQARQFVSDGSGHLLVTPTNKAALRVPVYGAAKPVSTTTASLTGDQIRLDGTGFAQGSGSTAYKSLASVMELGARSGQLPICLDKQVGGCASSATDRGGDIQYAGAGSAGDATWFGISTWGDFADIGNVTIPFVDYDVDGDGTFDYETYLQDLPNTDLLYAFTQDLSSGDLVDLEPVNFENGDVDTNVFDSSVVLMPVYKDAIGVPIDGTSKEITYQAGTFSAFSGAVVDSTDLVTYDAGSPSVSTGGPLYLDQGGSTIDVNHAGQAAASALVFHLHGAKGHRAEVVDLPAAP